MDLNSETSKFFIKFLAEYNLKEDFAFIQDILLEFPQNKVDDLLKKNEDLKVNLENLRNLIDNKIK
ncbi:MAG: hypothetical protein ACTSRZ_07025 [Promethearchaeota archaeon]